MINDEQVGDFDLIKCPYCECEIANIYDYGLKLDEHDDSDDIECPDCNKPFIIILDRSYEQLVATGMTDDYISPRKQFQQNVDQFKSSLSHHVLRKCCDYDGIISYYLEKPGGKTRMMSTYIIFTPEGIVISGDLCPNYGVVSNFGYGVGWFSNDLSSDYLCEKFISVDNLSIAHALLEAIQDAFSRQYRLQNGVKAEFKKEVSGKIKRP